MATKKFIPADIVPGPARRPLPYGLFSVLNFDSPVSPRWQAGGVGWDFFSSYDSIGSVGAPSGEVPTGERKPGQPETGLPKFQPSGTDPALPEIGAASPFSVYGYSKESAMASSPEDLQNDALSHLAIFEEQQVSKHLWFGDIGNEPNLEADVAGNTLTGGSPRQAVAELEEFIADTYGSLGVMYASRSTALLGIADKAFETRGAMLVTRLGTPVVVSHVFEDNEIRASAALMGFRSEPFMNTSPENRRLNYDIRQNNVTAIAERTYLLGYDPTGAASAPVTA